jgi:hypothetical protein
MSTKRIVALVVGCVLVLPALGMLFGGGALAIAYATQRNDDGYLDVTIDQLETSTVAITGEDVRFATEPGSPDWLIDAIDLDVQLVATALDPEDAIFIGIARQRDLDRYLADVAHDRVTRFDGGEPVYRRQGEGERALPAPADQDFWVARASGAGTQELTWTATSGRWAAAVLNADGSPGVAVTMTVGAKSGIVMPIALTIAGLGLVLTAGAVVLIVYGASGARRRDEASPPQGLAQPTPTGAPLPPPEPIGGEPLAQPEDARQEVGTAAR